MTARAIEIHTDDATWLRDRVDEIDDVSLVELAEVEFWGKTYEETPSGLYLPTDLSAEQRAIERHLAEVQEEQRPTVLDLFAGAGGFSLGMEYAGFDVVCGVEWDLQAAMTYLMNLGHPDCRIAFDNAKTEERWNQLHAKRLKKWKRGDMPKKKWMGSAYRQTVRRKGRDGMTKGAANEYVRDLNDPKGYNPEGGALGFYIGDIHQTSGAQLLELSGVDKFDVIVGGPPCQGLSTANARSCIKDPRNGLLWEYLRIVEETQPRAFIIENVPRLLTVAKGALFEAVCQRANKAGYDVVAQKVNACWYGVPQTRVRAIIVGQKEGSRPFQFPMPSHWALGRSVDGETWSMDVGDKDDERDVAVYDEESRTFSAPAPKGRAKPRGEPSLFGDDA